MIYKFESFNLFKNMLEKINRETLSILARTGIPMREGEPEKLEDRPMRDKVDMSKLQTSRSEAAARAGREEIRKVMPAKADNKVGRNDPCPCGSGLKYKACHGKGL